MDIELLNEIIKGQDSYIYKLELVLKQQSKEIELRETIIDEIIAQFDYSHDLEWRKDFKENITNTVKKQLRF